jgi:hypothetical protein
MKKLLVSGSRTITDKRKVFLELDFMIDGVLHGDDVTIIEGGARGVDTLAREYAIERNIPYEEHPADWDKNGRAAGYIRNVEMVKEADVALIIWDGKSKGAAHAMKTCEKKGVKYLLKLMGGSNAESKEQR